MIVMEAHTCAPFRFDKVLAAVAEEGEEEAGPAGDDQRQNRRVVLVLDLTRVK
jgi:hypothetical protein